MGEPRAEGDGLLTVVEAAALLRLRPPTIRAWVLRRKLPYVKLGRRVLFRRADLEALIASNIVPAALQSLRGVAVVGTGSGTGGRATEGVPSRKRAEVITNGGR